MPGTGVTEIWFDPNHGGALRVVSYNRGGGGGTIRGTDRDKVWQTKFTCVRGGKSIRVDFSEKRRTAHHGGTTVMVATYGDRRNTLSWPDKNVWHRVRSNVRKLRFYLH